MKKHNTSNRGFASMDPNKAEKIRSMGGKATSANREHMVEIGRRGGLKSGAVRKFNKSQKSK